MSQESNSTFPADFPTQLSEALKLAWNKGKSILPSKKLPYTTIAPAQLTSRSKKVLTFLEKKYRPQDLNAGLIALATDQIEPDTNPLCIDAVSCDAPLFIDFSHDKKNLENALRSIQRELLIDLWLNTAPNNEKLATAEQAFQMALQQFTRDNDDRGPSFYRGRRRLLRLIALSLSLSNSSAIVRILEDLWDSDKNTFKSSHSSFYETGSTMQQLSRIGILEVLSSDGLTPTKAALLFRADPDSTPIYILTEGKSCKTPKLQAVVHELVLEQLVKPDAGLAPFLWELQELHHSEFVIGACRLIEELKLTRKHFKTEPRFNKEGDYRREVWSGVQALLTQCTAFQAKENAKSFEKRLEKEKFKAATIKLAQGFVSEPYRAAFFNLGKVKNDQSRVRSKHSLRIRSIALRPGGGAVTLTEDGQLSVWSSDLKELESHKLFTARRDAIAVALSPNGTWAAALMATKKVIIYNIERPALSKGNSSQALTASTGLAITNDGLAFIGLKKGFASFGSGSAAAQEHKLKNKLEDVTKIVCSQSGTYVALGQKFGSLHLLKWPTLKPLLSIRGEYGEPLGFSEKEAIFISKHIPGVRLSSLPDGAKLKNKLRKADSHPFACSPSGQYIVCRSNNILKNDLIRFHIGPKLSSKVLEKKTVDYDGCAIDDHGLVYFSTCSSDGKSFYLHRWDPN